MPLTQFSGNAAAAMAAFILALCSATASASCGAVGLRALVAVDETTDAVQPGVAGRLPACWHWQWGGWRARAVLDAGFATILAEDSGDTFVATLGPMLRLGPAGAHWFVELGVAPTLLGDATFGQRDFGGSLQFTSSLAVGRAFGAQGRHEVGLRAQHVSNAGLEDPNPGLEWVGLDYRYRFGE